MAKLPPEIRVHVARNTTEDVWDIESILNVIQNEIEAREIGEKIKAMSSNTEPKRPQLPKIPTTGSFLVDSTPPLPTPTCVYCSEMHFSASRPKITDMCSRKAILKRDKRCFTCLRKKHNSEQCDKSCRKCNRKHHQSICPEQTINSPRNASKPPHPASGEQSNKAVENAGTTTATTTSKMQTRHSEYYCKQPPRSRQMTKERNRRQSDYYSTMAVNGHISQIAYDPGCNLNYIMSSHILL